MEISERTLVGAEQLVPPKKPIRVGLISKTLAEQVCASSGYEPVRNFIASIPKQNQFGGGICRSAAWSQSFGAGHLNH